MKRSTRIRTARERCRDVTVGSAASASAISMRVSTRVSPSLVISIMKSWMEVGSKGAEVSGLSCSGDSRIAPTSLVVGVWALGAGPRDSWRASPIWVTSLGHSGSVVVLGLSSTGAGTESEVCPPSPLAGGLLWAFAVSSIGQEVGGGDAVVLGGVVASLGDVVEQYDEVLAVIGAREYLVGESTRGVGWELLGCGGH